jgi:hypothetical protein
LTLNLEVKGVSLSVGVTVLCRTAGMGGKIDIPGKVRAARIAPDSTHLPDGLLQKMARMAHPSVARLPC